MGTCLLMQTPAHKICERVLTQVSGLDSVPDSCEAQILYEQAAKRIANILDKREKEMSNARRLNTLTEAKR